MIMPEINSFSKSDPDEKGWKGELGLEFSSSHGRTIISSRRHRGPLTLQRPFYPEGDEVCHVYALHPPGGVVGGDSLLFDIKVHDGAHALVTTPAAGKFYRTVGPKSYQIQKLTVDAGGVLDWLPLESIVYSGTDACLSTQVHLRGDAVFFGWEVVCLGLPASGALFSKGKFIQELEIYRDNEPVFIERGQYLGGSALLDEAWGLSGNTVFGTLVGTFDDSCVLENLRNYFLQEAAKEEISLSCMDGLTVCRVLGHSAFRVRDLLSAAWSAMRQKKSGRTGCPPRVWNT